MHPTGQQPDARLPVLVGVGTASASAPLGELLAQAASAAGADSGAPNLLRAVDRILVPQGSWALTNPGRAVAGRIGAPGAHISLCQVGVSQQEMINTALTTITRGEADVVLVVGGEARAYARAGGVEEADDPSAPPDPPDMTVTRPAAFVAPIEIAAGIVWPPVQQYALIENALGAHEQLDPASHRRQVAELWARCNVVAQGNPLAAFPTPRSAEDIAEPGPKNRPLAHPYNLWHSSQWTVDQAGALLLCAAETATAAGVPPDRWLFPHVAVHVSESVTLTARRHLHAWPAMEVLGRAGAGHLGRPLREVTVADLYSCFPSAVRVQQRALGLDPDGTPTVTGGMAFAGGPFNNYVLQSTAAVARLLRHDPGQLGLVTTVSGMLSKPGLAVWSATAPDHARGLLIGDLASEALAATPTLPVAAADHAPGPATVVAATVTFGGSDPLAPTRTAVVADLPDGQRTVATCEDAAISLNALTESLIGHTVQVDGVAFRP